MTDQKQILRGANGNLPFALALEVEIPLTWAMAQGVAVPASLILLPETVTLTLAMSGAAMPREWIHATASSASPTGTEPQFAQTAS